MAAYYHLCIAITLLLLVAQLTQTEWTGLPPLLETSHDVANYVNNMTQTFRRDMNKAFIKEFTKRSAEAGILQTQIDYVGEPHVSENLDVSATDFFTLDGANYAVISKRTLDESYIGLVRRLNGTLLVEPVARFSVKSFVDHQYRATYQASLRQRVIRLKTHVFGGQVFVLTELKDGHTLLFLVSDPHHSWLPKYQDSVLSPDEVASDFSFFEQTGQLFVTITVSHRKQSDMLIPARFSYIYRLKNGIKWLQTHTVSTPEGATSVTTFSEHHWTYIVIGQNAVRSLVYRLHRDTGTLELFQYLPTRRAVAVEAFTHHTQIYVLLVNQLGSATVFWWDSDQLFVWQTLDPSSGAGSVLEQVQYGHVGSFSSGENFIYLVSGNVPRMTDPSLVTPAPQYNISFYTTFSSQTGHFSLATSHSLPSTASVRHVQTTRVGRDGYYLLVSVQTLGSINWMEFPLHVTESSLGQRAATPQPPGSDELLSCLEQADQQLSSLDQQLDTLLQLAEAVFVRDADRNLTGVVSVTGSLTVTGLADVTELQIVSHQPSGEANPVDLGDLKDQIAECDASISDLNAGLQHSLTMSGRQTITGHYSFASLVVQGSLFINDASYIETLNGVSYQRLVQSTLTFTGDQKLTNPLSIGSGSVTSLTLAGGATINGLVATDLMYVSGSQTVTGRHHYRQAGVSGDLRLTGALNGIDLTSVLMLGQTLTVPEASLTQANVDALLVTNVNQRDFSAWRRNVIALNRPHTLPGHMIGHSATFSDLRITQLNGRHLDAFLRSLWKSPSDGVTGLVTLTGPLSVRDLTAGRVNGVTLASDLLTTDTDQLVTSHLRLHTLQVTLDLATDWVNGLDLSRQVVRTNGQPDSVSGLVVFAGDLAVTGDVTVSDDVTVNGVDVSEVSVMAAGGRRTLHFSHGVLLSGDWTVAGTVTLHSINGYTLGKLEDVFWTKDGQQDIEVSVTIANNLTVKHNLSVGTINGARPDSFIDVRRGGTLHSDVIFLGNVSVNDVTLPSGGALNGRDLSEFVATVVTRGGDQLIVGTKTFSGPVQMAALQVRDLNGLKLPEDLVLVDQDAIQTGSLTFLTDLEVVSDVSSSSDVDVISSINGYKVNDILANLTNVWVNRTTNHVLVIEGNVHFHDIHVVEQMNSGGVLELLESLLYTDRDTLVPGVFTVDGDVRFNSQLSLHTANGRSWAGYLSSLILSDVGGTVAGTTSVTSSLTVTQPADLLTSSLNGYTLQQLYGQYLTLHTHQLLRHLFTVHGTVSADVLNVNRVNNVPVNQLMFTDGDLHFYQSVHFFSEVAADELGVTSSTIGGCNLTQIWENGLRKSDASQKLSLPTTVGSLTVLGDVTLSHGDVIGQLVMLFDRIVTRTGNHTITGEVTFERPLAVTAAAMASYNGHSLVGLCEDALTTDMSLTSLGSPLTLLGPVTFGGDVTVLTAADVGLLNGEQLGPWLASLVLQGDTEVTLDGPLRIQQAAVAGHVLAPGLINGKPQSAWVELGSDITVSSLHFDRGLTIIDGLDVTGLVDGVNVSHVLETAVDLRSDATIAADIVFTGDLTVWMHLNAPRINDLQLSEELLLSYRLDRMQTVTGAKHFDTLLLDGGLCGRLNDVKLSQLCGGLLSSEAGAVQLVTQHLAFQHRPANLEEPAVGLAENLTAVTTLLRGRKDAIALWMAQLRTDIGRVRSDAATLLQTPDYSVDLAYLLEVQRLPVPHAAAVRSSGRDLRSLDVLLRTEDNCSLPVGCLCRSTNTLQIEDGGLLESPGEVQPGQRWAFHVRELQQVVTVTALTDGYSAQCQSLGSARVSVTSRSAEDPSAPLSLLPLAAALPGHVGDVQLFSFHGRLYMALAYGLAVNGSGTPSYPDTDILVLDGYRWLKVQQLPAYGATGLDLTKVDGVPHLLVVNRHSRESLSLQGEVQLWVWNGELQQFSELRALYHADIQAVAFLHAHDKVFVVIADLDGLTVLEYVAEDRQYSVCQYLAEPGVSAVTSFIVGDESYLVVFSNKLNELVVFLVTHQEGLKRHCWYPAAAVRSLAVYSSGRQLLLAAVHRSGLVVYQVAVRGRLSLVTTSAARLPPPSS